MSTLTPSAAVQRLLDFRLGSRAQTWMTLGMVLLGPTLALATFLIVNVYRTGAAPVALRIVVLADLVYVLIVAGLVFQRIARVYAARRAQSAGSRLHLRLTGVFGLMALVPTVLVAVFATLTVNFGLEGWFSERVRDVVGNSLAAAQAYEQEHRDGLIEDGRAIASLLDQARLQTPFASDGLLREALTSAQAQVQRGLKEAFVIDGGGNLRARGERSYLFDYERPDAEAIERAKAGEAVVIEDWDRNEFRLLVVLSAYVDRLLYVSRTVDGGILNLLDDTRETVALYQQLEQERGTLLFEFAILYLSFALILILAAVWLGLWFAERLSRPVGRLAGAAQRVGAGDFAVRVEEEAGDDEIAMLGRVFNQMTRQLKGQREALVDAHDRSEESRRLFDSVLSGVTTGVIGLNADRRIDFLNPAAERLLELDRMRDHHAALADAVPEFAPLLDELSAGARAVSRRELRLTRSGRLESLLVRMASRRSEGGEVQGYVVTFDDVTDLVTAQRMAAWGDVARRIAHEIKNPLTPIQLSAERLKRKFMPLAGDQAEALEQYTDVIVRQTGDLRRIVDEFSRFARMPTPERRREDLTGILRDVVHLESERDADTRIDLVEDGPVFLSIDRGMFAQAFTNLLKNASEAIDTYLENNPDTKIDRRIAASVAQLEDRVLVTIADNGIGLPADRSKLFEPYVTTRAKGTGLGLAIVKKIIEEHGGTLELTDAPGFDGDDHAGAMARITLPRDPADNATDPGRTEG